MTDASSRGAPPRRFGVWLAFLTTGLLSSCGSDSAVSPTPTPSPSPPAFVHMLDPGQHWYNYEQVLWTFKADPRSGELVATATTAAPSDWSDLAADPRGRFVYVLERPAGKATSIVAYRVDGSTGGVALASEVQTTVADGMWAESLAAASTHLYFGGWISSGHASFRCLGVLDVGESGLSSEPRLVVRDPSPAGGFYEMYGVDAERDVVYAAYDWTYELRALTLVPDATLPGYRELARVALHDPGVPPGILRNLVAAGGRAFFTDEAEWLFSYVPNETSGAFEERGRVPDGGSVLAAGAGGRLAVATPGKRVEYDSQHHATSTTSIVLYQVGTEGALTPVSGLPEGYFQGTVTSVFHPAGSFLYACGILAAGSPPGSVVAHDSYLLTFAVGADGSLTLAGSLAVARCGEMVVTSPGS